jgi:hypothetical protein
MFHLIPSVVAAAAVVPSVARIPLSEGSLAVLVAD